MEVGANARNVLALALLYVLFTGNTVTGQKDERKIPDTSDKEPEFVPTIQNITIPTGSTASLNCIVENLEPYTVTWIRGDSKTVLTLGQIVSTMNPRVSLGRERSGSFELVIKDVRLEDSGSYLCQVSSYPTKSLEFFIHIADDVTTIANPERNIDVASSEQPKVAQVLPSTAVIAGHTASLQCNFNNSGGSQISWVHEDTGKVLSVGPNESTRDSRVSLKHETNESSNLIIKDIRREDSGTYACHLHSDPKKILHFIVRVVDTPALSSTSIKLDTEHSQLFAVLKCTARGVPRPRFYWSKDQNILDISGENYEVKNTPYDYGEIGTSLSLRNIGVDDLGIYRCHAKNNVGEESARFRITRDIINSVVIESSRKDRPTATHANQKFAGKQAECVHSASLTKDRDNLAISRSVDVANRNMGPLFTTPAKKITTKLGQTVALNCSVQHLGHNQVTAMAATATVTPLRPGTGAYELRSKKWPRITWRRFERQQLIAIGPVILVPSSRFSAIQHADGTRTLVIKDVQYEDRGLYSCLNPANPMQKKEIFVDIVVT